MGQGLAGAPAPFDKGSVKVAVVSFLGWGDRLQAFEAGTKRQADALGVELTVSQARNDPDARRQLVEQAINPGVDGIVINNGRPEPPQDVAQNAGVRAFDISDPCRPVETGALVPAAPRTSTDRRPNRPQVVQTADVFVDSAGLVYASDNNGGLAVVEYGG